jgi:YbgC/YbaW family acyl-CoA thioester hydrolase
MKVTWQDLDILDMVNNAVYIAHAEEALTQALAAFGWSPVQLQKHGLARSVHRLHIQYHAPAMWGDTLNLALFSLKLDPSGGSLYVDIARAFDGASIASCILDWGLIDRASGAAQPLPDSLFNALENTVAD